MTPREQRQLKTIEQCIQHIADDWASWHVSYGIRLRCMELEAELKEALLADLKAGFNPDQPRVPAGSSEGGQWTTSPGSGGQNPAATPLPSPKPEEVPWWERVDWGRVIEENPGYDAAIVLAALRSGRGLPAVYARYGRKLYTKMVRDLAKEVPKMRAKGMSSEEIARILSARRRRLGEIFKKITPPKLKKEIFGRNARDYGDELGPSIEKLRARGKSWEEIIESSSRTGGKDLGL